MGQKSKQILALIAGIILFVFIYSSVSYVFLDHESTGRYSAFFEEKENIDVFFIGSSHVRHGIFPMELYRDHGIISYNLAGNGDTLPVSYWKLKMALDYKRPKLVVLDIYDLWPGKKTSSEGIGQVHTSIDCFPLTKNKIDAIYDLFDDENDRLAFIWKFSAYHNKWDSLDRTSFRIDYNASNCKGAYPLLGFVQRIPADQIDVIDDPEFDTLAYDYLKRIITLCDENKIELLLINTGYDVNNESQMFADSCKKMANEAGLNYIDFPKLDIIDFETDLHSTGQNTHVNSAGAVKLTNYIGNYISEKYEIDNNLSNEKYASWKNTYIDYVNTKRKQISVQEDLNVFLTGLYDKDFSVIVILDGEKDLSLDESTYKLINNMSQNGIEIDSDSFNRNLIFIQDNTINKTSVFHSGDSVKQETNLGKIDLSLNESDMYFNLTSDTADYSLDTNTGNIHILVIDNYSRKIVITTAWNNYERIELDQ